MATQVKLRRGTTAEHASFTGAEGEVTVDTTKDTAVVHDGSTAGGHPLSKESHNHAGVYDPAGTAASAVATHEAAGDPHPAYLLEADAASTYATISHNHAASAITSGTIDVARLPDASTTAKGVVELATDGETSSGVVVQGNDSRLSNARTPTGHTASHKHGGSDEIATVTPASNQIPKAQGSGTLDAGWLPDADVDTKGAVTPTTVGMALIDASSQSAGRDALGLGSAAVENMFGTGQPVGLTTLVATFEAIIAKGAANGYCGLDASAKVSMANIALTNASNSLGADASISVANTWVDGASVSLAAGTWLLNAHITILRNTTTAMWSYARITDGPATTHYASGETSTASVANQAATISLTAVVTLGSTTTIKVQGTASQTATIKAALHANGSGNNATSITAVRIT